VGFPVPGSWFSDAEDDTAPSDLEDGPEAADSIRIVVKLIELEPTVVEFTPVVATVVAGSTVIVPCSMA
jgi:hypothetical protein